MVNNMNPVHVKHVFRGYTYGYVRTYIKITMYVFIFAVLNCYGFSLHSLILFIKKHNDTTLITSHLLQVFNLQKI